MSYGPLPVELPADCPSCRLESGLVELYDASAPPCRFGVPKHAKCKLCALTFEGRLDDRGDSAERHVVAVGAKFETEADLVRALDAWAEREGFADRDALLEATFPTPRTAHLFSLLRRGDRIEVLADPFARWGMRGARNLGGGEPSEPDVDDASFDDNDDLPESAAPSTRPPRLRSPSSRAPWDPYAVVYPVVSVLAADGEFHGAERRFLANFLEKEGLDPMSEDAVRVHPPSACAHLVPRARREQLVQTMCEASMADGLSDESERRVIRAYAAAWKIPDDQVDFWLWGHENMNTSLVRQLWLRLRRFFLPARWGSEPTAPPATDPTRPYAIVKESR